MAADASSIQSRRWPKPLPNSMPWAVCSCSNHAPPRPRIARPSLMWSMVVTVFATSPGLRNVLAPTSRPSRTRDVTFAHAASVPSPRRSAGTARRRSRTGGPTSRAARSRARRRAWRPLERRASRSPGSKTATSPGRTSPDASRGTLTREGLRFCRRVVIGILAQNVISSTSRTSELNRAPTLSPRWMRLIASPNSGATDRIVRRESSVPGGSGTVSVTTISVIGEPRDAIQRVAEKTPCVAHE